MKANEDLKNSYFHSCTMKGKGEALKKLAVVVR